MNHLPKFSDNSPKNTSLPLDHSNNNQSNESNSNNATIEKRNLPFKNPDDALARSGDDKEDIKKPPVVAIILTSLCIIFVVVVLVVVWAYSRRRKQNDVMELKWQELEENKVSINFLCLKKLRQILSLYIYI